MHLAALKFKQKKIFERLNFFSEFYLVGGTALALQIGHRVSADFDLFSKKDLSPNLLRKVKQVFAGLKIEILFTYAEQISVKVDNVKIDFVQYKFPFMLKPIIFHNVKLARILEIAAMKAFVLSYRGTLKDYIDLYFILSGKCASMDKIKKIAEKKYENEFNFRLFLEQLVYLKDVKEEKIEFLREKITQGQMEEFFEKEIKKIKL